RPAQHRDRQQRLQHRPLLIRKIPSPHTEIITVRSKGQRPLLKHALADPSGYIDLSCEKKGCNGLAISEKEF
ncbi:hypothetical protein, partial [Streptosporangium sp. NPDC049078]|uniref:hypothetical protein n=1 Tax=Streptosporangium sp. NPDC049078 TaxID=3155767 RepID=UPI0034153E05